MPLYKLRYIKVDNTTTNTSTIYMAIIHTEDKQQIGKKRIVGKGDMPKKKVRG